MVRFTDTGDEPGDELAPVIPLFAAGTANGRGATPRGPRPSREQWHPMWTDEPEAALDDPADPGIGPDRRGEAGPRPAAKRPERSGRRAAPHDSSGRDAAEKALLRRLRTRSLSLREARAVIAEHGLPSEEADELVEAFVRLGYLDDARLAEQLIHSGADRKGQGRTAIAQTLAKRGIPGDVADAALQTLPDDDAERALEFARSKARSMRGLDRDTAMRRLSGQLARRGYGGAAAMNAARTALDETDRPVHGVRFQ